MILEITDETTAIKGFAIGRKFKIRRDGSSQTKNVIYVAYCLNCQKQGVGSTVSWNPPLRNYKWHNKNNVKCCKIVRYFIKECKGVSNLRFIIDDVFSNVDHFSSDAIDDVLLQKEQFWIGTLVKRHKGLSGTHDWGRTKRFQKEK